MDAKRLNVAGYDVVFVKPGLSGGFLIIMFGVALTVLGWTWLLCWVSEVVTGAD